MEAQVQTTGKDVVGGNPGQFYISDVVEHGNSGGPVFDASGNVIGVVVAITSINTVNQSTKEIVAEKKVGVVIDLGTLKDFLLAHGVFTQWSGSYLTMNNGYIEDRAKDYIVNVQCRMPPENLL
jgi:S1-C subfamily serine protease